MYGTTIRSYNESKSLKHKKLNIERSSSCKSETKKAAPRKSKKEQDTRYMRLDSTKKTDNQEFENENEAFSFKELPIVSVVITVILTMMMLVMTSGFGEL